MKSKVHPTYKTKYRVANWPAYNRALVRSGDVTVWLSSEAIAAWTPRRSGRRGGQRRYSDLAIETALTLRLLYHLPLRQAEGFLHALFGMMRLDLSAPDYTTLSRRSRHLRRRLRPVPPGEGLHLVLDSTGLSIVGAGEWAAAKHGGRGRRGWRKLHLGVDQSGVIRVHTLTEETGEDATTALELLTAVEGPLVRVTADAAYDTVAVYETAGARGATVVIPPARTANVSGHGPRSLIPLGLLHIEELLDEEVTALAGERYARKDPSVGGRRHGSNPGTVGLAGQRVPIRVPRIRHVTEREIPLRSYEALHGDRAVNDLLLRRVLYGISCRNYAAAAEAIPGAIGLSGSTVSRAFIQASATKLRELQERDLSGEDVVALVLDGKTFAEATMVVALGITMTGDKRFLGFVETDIENVQVLTPFLRSLVERGLDVSQGLLVIVDGGKGLRAAVRKAFRHRALVQRCQWHKRENVVSYLAKREQPVWRQRLQRAYNRPEYDEALAALQSLQHELEDRNQSADGSLAEGLDETLTLHRLGVYGVLGRSLKTTNGLESINALIEERCAKVDHWQNSSQRQRWLATALLDIEPRLRKVMGYRHLPRLRDALKRELKIDTTTSKTKAA